MVSQSNKKRNEPHEGKICRNNRIRPQNIAKQNYNKSVTINVYNITMKF